jgi:hypothetical protein
VGPLGDFDGSWLSDAFESRVRQFLVGFRDPGGAVVAKPTLVVRSGLGMDGAAPTIDESRAMEAAIAYATVNANPYWSPGLPGWGVATADNADLWVQPIDVESGFVALGRGGRVLVRSGGHQLGDAAFSVPAPLELHLPFVVHLDAELMEAVYELLLDPPSCHRARVSRLRIAIRWLTKSWLNSASISEEDRLVFLKTASEALVGSTGGSRQAAGRLRGVFETARGQEGGGHGLDALLWSPDEPTFLRGGNAISALEHWYMALADARNQVVHGEPDAPRTYDEAGSPYAGPFVETGDRVLREAIDVELGNCGYPAVWRRGIQRAGFLTLRRLREMGDESEPEA